jgi:hypothetical protein
VFLRLAAASWIGLGSLLLLCGVGTGHAFDGASIAGEWIGERDGQVISWRLDGVGRLRIDGRPADYTISHDTLRVRFDAAPRLGGASCERETAVYRFMVGSSKGRSTQLFVYGFDLGAQGLWLERPEPEPPLAEDAAPPPPPPAPAAANGPADSPVARVQPPKR